MPRVMRASVPVALVAVLALGAHAQSIDPNTYWDDVKYLASPELNGRATGSPQLESAAVHIAIPFARSVNPVTGTNWQGAGVVPDVAVPQEQAYDVAYAAALRDVLARDELFPRVADEARETLAGHADLLRTYPAVDAISSGMGGQSN